MANATPVHSPEAKPEAPAAADERVMPPAESKKAPKPAPKVEMGDLEAQAEAARKNGKTAFVTGNAVRIDN